MSFPEGPFRFISRGWTPEGGVDGRRFGDGRVGSGGPVPPGGFRLGPRIVRVCDVQRVPGSLSADLGCRREAEDGFTPKVGRLPRRTPRY